MGIYWTNGTDRTRLSSLQREGVDERNIRFIEEFNNVNRNEGSGIKRRVKLIGQCVILARMMRTELSLYLDELNREVIRNVMGFVYENTEWRSYTKKDYFRLMTQLCQRHPRLDPEMMKGLKFNAILDTKSEKEVIITEDDSNKVLRYCTNKRNRAFISLLHETGMRSSEILNIRFKDIMKEDKCWLIKIDGKTGVREVVIVKAIRFLIDYINSLGEHKPDEYIWRAEGNFHKGKGRRLRYAGANKIVQEAFVAAGLDHLKHNLHFFRHSRATLNAQWMPDSLLCKFFGWELGSGQAANYVKKAGLDVKKAILKQNGLCIEESEKKTCPTCGCRDYGDMKLCPICGTPQNLEYALKHKEDVKDEMDKSVKLLMGTVAESSGLNISPP
ncbi:tyrosine-type recombinase/integrase [Candidatus Woesearchaeota archaeon]|nr:tyrosine-type recombinase/integrase [Candidatus Woesearchaeota archaeon]